MRTIAILAAFMMLVGCTAVPMTVQTPKASMADSPTWTSDQGDWMPLPDIFPAGAHMKVIHGNPATGASELYFRFPAGYGAPWHFHTPREKVMVQQGTMRFELRSGRVTDLGPGGYIQAPPRSPHLATCVGEETCYFFLVSDGPFDVHLVDENWNTTRSWYAGGSPPSAGTGAN